MEIKHFKNDGKLKLLIIVAGIITLIVCLIKAKH